MASYIGTPTSRIEGHAKVTGAAKYAGEIDAPNLAYGSVVASSVAKGRIVSIDMSDAMNVHGVIAVLTHQNRAPMARSDRAYMDDTAPETGSPFRPLYDDKVRFSGQPIALVHVTYAKEAHSTDLDAQRDKAKATEMAPKPRGKADKALSTAAVRHHGEYTIPVEHHNPMELFASTVIWSDDGKLTVHDKTQGVQNVQRYICNVFGMKADDVRVMSPYVGGGFGSGLRPQYQVALAVMAARALRRSVRLALTRQQMSTLGFRPGTIERVGVGAEGGGMGAALQQEGSALA